MAENVQQFEWAIVAADDGVRVRLRRVAERLPSTREVVCFTPEAFLSTPLKNVPRVVIRCVPGNPEPLAGWVDETLKTAPRSLVVLIVDQDQWDDAVESIRRGAWHFFPVGASDDRIRRVIQEGLLQKFPGATDGAGPVCGQPSRAPTLVGDSPPIQEVKRLIRMVKDYGTTVLITGETGTGKELVAQAIHYSGRRGDGPFLCINCAAIPNDLLEDELFGHVKGAFTGAAANRKGYFEQSHAGTLFLDEIGNMSAGIQQKLLRVLQDRQITPLGTTKVVDVDVRIVAATNSDLDKAVREGTFREDLFYRLNVFPIALPPLRDRRDDTAVLADYFLRGFAAREGLPPKRFSPDCVSAMERYPWPGNIRELRNLVEYAMIVSEREQVIRLNHLKMPGIPRTEPSHVEDTAPTTAEVASAHLDQADQSDKGEIDFSAVVQTVERRLLLDGLRRTGGNKQKAAKLLKMKRTTLVEKLKRLNMDPGIPE